MKAGAKLSAHNLARAIEARRHIPLARFIYALGIRRIGESNARLLARHYGGFANWRGEMLAAAEPGSEARAELDSIIGIGPAIAEELADFFAEQRNIELLDELAGELTIEDAAPPRRPTAALPARRGVHRHAGNHDAPRSQGARRGAGCEGHRQRLEEDRPRGRRRGCRIQGAQGDANSACARVTEAEWRDLAGLG